MQVQMEEISLKQDAQTDRARRAAWRALQQESERLRRKQSELAARWEAEKGQLEGCAAQGRDRADERRNRAGGAELRAGRPPS